MGLKPQISSVGSDHCSNFATFTVLFDCLFCTFFLACSNFKHHPSTTFLSYFYPYLFLSLYDSTLVSLILSLSVWFYHVSISFFIIVFVFPFLYFCFYLCPSVCLIVWFYSSLFTHLSLSACFYHCSYVSFYLCLFVSITVCAFPCTPMQPPRPFQTQFCSTQVMTRNFLEPLLLQKNPLQFGQDFSDYKSLSFSLSLSGLSFASIPRRQMAQVALLSSLFLMPSKSECHTFEAPQYMKPKIYCGSK